MKLEKIRIKNFRSIKDSGDIVFSDNLFVLAGQNESGKSSILEALKSYENDDPDKDTLNFELENTEENLIQEIHCTFNTISNNFFDRLSEDILELVQSENAQKSENEENEELVLSNIIDEKKLRKINRFTLTRIYNYSKKATSSTLKLNDQTLAIVQAAIKDFKVKEGAETHDLKKTYLDTDIYASDIANFFWQHSPKIILFNDFTTLLPDKILLNQIEDEQIEGQVAVKNLEKLLNIKFEKIAQKNTPQKNSTTESESKIISANFQKDWQQKIYGNNDVRIKFFIENNDKGEKEILFYVETKDNEFLSPRKRSKGMIWFLSLWLELKSKVDEDNLILLFDEPGMHLHIKASRDMLNVFHKLIEKGRQIIYSTHSPSLIETSKLHNIGLVINTKKYGTLVEGLTTSKINSANKQDALQPIAEAMGMEPLKDFSVLKLKNVLTEGLSDFWYYKAIVKITDRKIDYEFIPGIGVKNNKIFHLISFCIGYGLEWVLILDNGTIPNQIKDELKNSLFDNNIEELNKHLHFTGEKEIENMFSFKDLLLVDSSIKENGNKTPAELIGEKTKNCIRSTVFSKSK